MPSTLPQPPFTYNLAEFMARDVEIDLERIPEYESESAARAARARAGAHLPKARRTARSRRRHSARRPRVNRSST
jgi:hypothetical protein